MVRKNDLCALIVIGKGILETSVLNCTGILLAGGSFPPTIKLVLLIIRLIKPLQAQRLLLITQVLLFLKSKFSKLLCLLQSQMKPDSPLPKTPLDSSSLSFANMAGISPTLHTISPNVAHCLSSSSFINLHSSNFWIVDSGATDHMVCSLSLFSTLSKPINATVSLPNGQLLLA